MIEPATLKKQINTNALHYAKLQAKFKTLGFTNLRAIARVVSDTTGTAFTTNYRALLYLNDMDMYLELMERTLESLKNE